MYNVSRIGLFYRNDPRNGKYAATVGCDDRNNDECGLRSIITTCTNKQYFCQFAKSK